MGKRMGRRWFGGERDAVSQTSCDHIRTEQQEAGISLQSHVTSSYNDAHTHTKTHMLRSACRYLWSCLFVYFRLLRINTYLFKSHFDVILISTDENLLGSKVCWSSLISQEVCGRADSVSAAGCIIGLDWSYKKSNYSYSGPIDAHPGCTHLLQPQQ